MKTQSFTGTGVAVVTPFINKAVDFDGLGKILEHLVEGGVDYIVSLGTTGEAVNLTTAECREVLDYTIKKIDGRIPIVAGHFGGNFTDKLVANLKTFDFSGIAGIMSSSPSYIKPSQKGILQHYMAVAEASPLPIIIYNVPGRTSSNILPETILQLAEASTAFAAVKEASGNIVQGAQIIKYKPDHFQVISGDDPTALGLIALGGEGVISVIANAYPREFSDMIRAGLAGDFATASQLNMALLEVHPWLYAEGNPTGIKAALELLGLCSRETRIPLTAMTEEGLAMLKQEMNKAKSWLATKV